MAEIEIKNLHKSFGDFIAVKNSNLIIENKEFFVLLGPSGCGKTTTLRMIAGLELPTSGNIYLDKEDVSYLRASQRDIAFVFQLFALYPHLNVRNNLAFPLKMQGYSKQDIETRVMEAAKLLRIDHILKSKTSGLAGGDRQRVALGRALVRRPKAFLMDEPLGALDALTREKMQSLVLKIWKETGKTIILITHSVEEALLLGERLYVMAPRPGRIHKEYNLPFASMGLKEDLRDIKNLKDFTSKREEILTMIWNMEEEIMGKDS